MGSRNGTAAIAAMAAAAALFIAAPASASLIVSAGDPALAGATLLDFNGEAAANQGTRTFGGEVTFTISLGTFNVGTAFNGAFGATGTSIYTPNGQNFTIDFATEVSAFGFTWGAVDTPWTMQTFDSSNTPIETFAISSTPLVRFIGAAGAGISRVTMSNPGYDFIVIDDFRYVAGTAAVPETPTLAVFGLGLAGLAFARRRRAA